jgi:hypothetical protein
MKIHKTTMQSEKLFFIVILTSGKKTLLYQRGLTIQMQADGRKPLVLSSRLPAAADLSR